MALEWFLTLIYTALWLNVILNSNIFVSIIYGLSCKHDMIQVMLVKSPLKMNLHVTGNWLQACFFFFCYWFNLMPMYTGVLAGCSSFQGTHIWQDNKLLHNKIIFPPSVLNLFKSCILNLCRYVRGWEKIPNNVTMRHISIYCLRHSRKQQHVDKISANIYICQLKRKKIKTFI